MQRLPPLSRSSSAQRNGVTVSSFSFLIRSFCAPLPAAARRRPKQLCITSTLPSILGYRNKEHHFHLEQRRNIETNRHVREGVSERQPGDKPVGLLKGSPTFTPRETDLKQNFLEVDPDNPTRLLEYFANLLKHGNLEPSEAQKELMKEMQVLMDAIEAENFKTRGAAFEAQAPSVSDEMHREDHSSSQPLELHRIKREQPDVEDPLFEVARKISNKAQVLCFDEFQVVHITDAMIMKRLFEGLFSLGAIVVATSNRAPQELYLGGLNRERFLPFIPLLERCCKVYHIDTKKDYRLAKGGVSCRSLFYAPPRQEKVIFEELEKAAGGPLEPGEIQVAMGRTLKGPRMQGGFAAFTFAELCGANVGPSDYLALASRFHTVSLRDIPDLHQMDQHPNEIRRFISLIDVLYERTIRVLFDAEAPIFRLLGIPDSVKLMEEFRQALRARFSRLTEAFEALGRDCKEADMYAEGEWVAAAPKVLGLSSATAQALFQLMTNDGTTVLTPKRIRSLLFFHLACYDFKAPTTADVFLFSSEEEANAVLREPATYALNKWVPSIDVEMRVHNSNVESSGAQDNQFAFIRTVSRIRDMTSLPYLLAHQKTYKLKDLALLGIHWK
ncbi:hypothetical protein ACSSS7_003315 [Eimeria intestinalis]